MFGNDSCDRLSCRDHEVSCNLNEVWSNVIINRDSEIGKQEINMGDNRSDSTGWHQILHLVF